MKKTHEEFVEQLFKINPNIKITGTYKTCNDHIKCLCKICSHEWDGLPNNLLRGSQCPYCSRKNRIYYNQKNTQQFVEEMKTVNSNIEILGEYIHSKEKIKCKCIVCNNIWETIPNALLRGRGCPVCANNIVGDKNRKTQEQFIEDMSKAHPELEVIGKYINNKIKITCRCKDCGNIFDILPNSLLSGQGCPPCSKKRGHDKTKLSHEEFMRRINLLNPTYKIIDRYVDCETKVRCLCDICGGIWKAAPIKLLNERGCPVCLGKKCVIGINDIATKRPDLIKYFVDKNNIYKYTIGSNKRLMFQCPDCGHKKEMNICTLTSRGFSCNVCSDSISYPNKYMREFLSQLPVENVDYEYSPKWVKPLRYDSYFEYNGNAYIVEMDGGLGHGNRKYCSNEIDIHGLENDRIKDELAKEHNIKVIRIDCLESDSDYISNNILNSELSNILDLSDINWGLCDMNATKNLVKEVCEYFNKTNLSTSKIAKTFKLGTNTVRRYLKRGTKFGWCNYAPTTANGIDERVKKLKKTVEVFSCENDKKVLHTFEGLVECVAQMSEMYNLKFNRHGIGKVCNGKQDSYKGFIFKYVA